MARAVRGYAIAAPSSGAEGRQAPGGARRRRRTRRDRDRWRPGDRRRWRCRAACIERGHWRRALARRAAAARERHTDDLSHERRPAIHRRGDRRRRRRGARRVRDRDAGILRRLRRRTFFTRWQVIAAFILALTAASVSGVVHDTSGGAVSGAAVVVRAASGSEQRVTTGPDGRFTIDAPETGAVTLVVKAEGFAEKTQQLPSAHAGAVDVVLEPATLFETVTVTPTRTAQRLGDTPA